MLKKLILLNFLSLFLGLDFSFAKCEKSFVPPTTESELLEIREWAIVLAFIPMAEKAGYHFDSELYLQQNPNPNQAAFNFGYVSGRSCYPIEVATAYESYSVVLTRLHYLDFENFKAFYIKEAERYGYLDYLTPLAPAEVALSMN